MNTALDTTQKSASEFSYNIPNPPPLEVHDLTVAYHRKPVLWDIDFVVPEGVLIGIVGPNGAGKSTLLKSAMGLVPPASGWVKCYGEPISKQRQKIGYVPQRESVDWDFPTDVLDVVLMGVYGRLGWFRRPAKRDREYAMGCLKQVGMADFANRQISQLSGGQQQRVFLARALAQNSTVYFMDEPFAGVDVATEKAIITLLKALKSQGKTVFVVHHDLQTVNDYFDWVLMINMRLITIGPTEDVFTEDNLRKTYGGRLNIISELADAVSINQPHGVEPK
ncbi:MAG: metal ABC transporter ATP-binding protein [Candidatus Hinthialibacter antarcticus]|nr:metal ABC transporter ATP-binding protein [Candidatus Hinthialibacter antarcticus]